MAAELSMLMGYGSGEDEDEQMADDDMDGAGGKVILVGHSQDPEEEQEDESVEELPLFQPQPESRPRHQEDEEVTGDESPISHVNGGTPQEAHPDAIPMESADDDDYLILPPELREAPPGECNPGIQEKVASVLRAQRTQGKMFSRVLQEMRGYRNPDFLEKMISHFNIKERGSNFSKDVFDPYGLAPEDFIDAMEKQLIEARAKKEQDRANRKQIEFAKGGVQAAKPSPALTAQAQAEVQAKARQLTRRGWDK